MKIKAILYFILFCILSLNSYAQEIEATITIDNQQAPNIQKNILDDVQQNLTNFFNNRRWTNDDFSPQERIKLNMLITLSSGASTNRYPCTMQMQIIRPVYNTTYETVLLNFIDQFYDFTFTQGQPLDFNENIFINQLISTSSFFIYIALAMDYDSYGKLSGSPWIEKAFNISNIAQSTNPAPLESGRKNGWDDKDFSNRYALIKDLNNQQFVAFREVTYIYHREAMDNFLTAPDSARIKIYSCFEKIQEIYKINPVSILIRSFFLAKKDEIIQIYSKADIQMKEKVVAILRQLDPSNAEKYQTIMTSN